MTKEQREIELAPAVLHATSAELVEQAAGWLMKIHPPARANVAIREICRRLLNSGPCSPDRAELISASFDFSLRSRTSADGFKVVQELIDEFQKVVGAV